MKISDIVPAPDERLFISGKSGSGKSTLSRKIIASLPRDEVVIIFDTKDEWVIPRYNTLFQRKQIRRLPLHVPLIMLPGGIYVYKPSYPESQDGNISRILIACLRRKNCTIVIHELTDLARGTTAIPALGKTIRQGRAKHVRMIIETQRPSAVPLIAITEANKIVTFRLRSLDDRKRLAQWVAPEMLQLPPQKHDFWYCDDELNDGVPFLVLQNRTNQFNNDGFQLLPPTSKSASS